MPSILIAEDHGIVRLGLLYLVKEIYPDAYIAEAETFDQIIQHIDAYTFDLVLLDIQIPGGDNLQMVEAIKLRTPSARVLIVSGYNEELYALHYIEAGAHGYLQKNSSSDIVKQAIQKVMADEKYISASIREQLIQQKLNSDSRPALTTPLSNREMEIMHLLVKGISTSGIRDLLNIRKSTVSTYKAKIFEKMMVDNIIDLAEKARLLNIDQKRN